MLPEPLLDDENDDPLDLLPEPLLEEPVDEPLVEPDPEADALAEPDALVADVARKSGCSCYYDLLHCNPVSLKV